PLLPPLATSSPYTTLFRSSFEESQFYRKFEETKFLFVVFQYRETLKENSDRIPYFKKVVLWNMPEQTIRNEVGLMWRRGRKVLKDRKSTRLNSSHVSTSYA